MDFFQKRLSIVNVIAAVTLMFLTGGKAHAVITNISFDDAYGDSVFDPATYYQATDGVTFSGTYFGVVGGVGNGDPGNWDLFGTNGSAFLGTNQDLSGSPTINFANSINSLSFDVGVPFGWNQDFLVTGFLGGSTVTTQSFSITDDNNGNGTWQTVNIATEVDSVMVQKTSGIGSGYGIDNYTFDNVAEVPFEVSPNLGLLLVGGLIVSNHVYRKHKEKEVSEGLIREIRG